MNIGTPGYRSPEQQKIAEQFQMDKFVPPGHWFLKEHNYDTKNEKYQNHTVDPYGYHTNNCDGIHIKENSLLGYSICCGKTYCSICDTPLHGCTANGIYLIDNMGYIKCHEFCYEKWITPTNI